MNWIYDHGVYLPNFHLHMRLNVAAWRKMIKLAKLFNKYIQIKDYFNWTFFIEQRKKKSSNNYIFWEKKITSWNRTLLWIKLAGGFESKTQSASKRKESSIKFLQFKSIKWPGHSPRIGTCSCINLIWPPLYGQIFLKLSIWSAFKNTQA